MSGTLSSRPRAVAAAVCLFGAAVAASSSALIPRAAHAQSGAAASRDGDQMERPEVRGLEFRGVRSVSRGDLQDALATRASSCVSLVLRPVCAVTRAGWAWDERYLDRDELARDVIRVLAFYYRRGWRDAQVDTAVVRDGSDAVRVTFTVREGRPTTVRQVLVADPQRTLRPRELRRLVGLRRGDPFDLLKLDSAVVRLREAYWERGYADVRIERPVVGIDSVADTVAVAIPVRRGLLQRVDSIVVLRQGQRRGGGGGGGGGGGRGRGARAADGAAPEPEPPVVSEQSIRNSLVIREGDLFRWSQVGRSQRALYEASLFRSAVLDTAVAPLPGTGRLGCASQAGLRITEARPPIPDEPPPDSTKTLVVCTVEAPLRETRVSAGVTTADFGQVEARWAHNYFLGGPRRFEVSGVVGNLGAQQLYRAAPFRGANGFDVGSEALTQLAQQGRYFAPTYQLSADLRRRWFLDPRNTVGVGLFTHRRSAPGVFVDRGQGANLSFTRNVAPNVPISATYRFELNRVEAGDLYFCVNFAVCDRATATVLQRQQRLSPIALTGSVNRTDRSLSPTRGVLARFSVEYASRATLSDFAYARAQLEASTYRTLPFRRTVLALRTRVGHVRSLGGTNRALGVNADAVQLLHPRTRFYAGGSQSVRGFGENQLGPRVLTVAPSVLTGADGADCPDGTVQSCRLNATRPLIVNGLPELDGDSNVVRVPVYGDGSFVPRPLGGTTLVEANVELRIPIVGPVVGALFVDGALLGERSLANVWDGTRAITPGFGVRYNSPVGPIRVDLGIRPRLQEAIPVVTQTTGDDGQPLLVELDETGRCLTRIANNGCRRYPTETPVNLLGRLARRVTLHVSIGEAF